MYDPTQFRRPLPAVEGRREPGDGVTSAEDSEAVESAMSRKRTDEEKTLARLVRAKSAETCKQLAIKARQEGRPNDVFAIVYEMTTASKAHRLLVAETLAQVIQHPSDITEFVALYWAKGSRLLSKQVKLGLARAFTKFSEREFAEHREGRSGVKLRDVIALVHPKPMNCEQGRVFAKLCNKTFLPTATKFAKFPVARVYRKLAKLNVNNPVPVNSRR
jgi:hypothetical protein